jgi:flagellar protein FlgJ
MSVKLCRFWTAFAAAIALHLLLAGSAQAAGELAAAGGQPKAKVNSDGVVLTVRSGPATDKRAVGSLADGTKIKIRCRVWGQQVTGTERRTAYWDRLGDGRYVSDAFIRWTPTRPKLPWCGTGVDAVRATVGTDELTLNVRSGPGTRYPRVGEVDPAEKLPVRCQAWGEDIHGNTHTAVWVQIGPGRYVADAFVRWSRQRPWLPWCGQEPPTVPPATSTGFIARSAGPARAGQRAYRVPASVTMAQAILESSWGRSGLTRNDHNYFAMKCAGGPGAIALGCRDYATSECSATRCWSVRGRFRGYRNATDSYADHGRQLSQQSRYATAMKHAADADRFAREIHKAGYSTGAGYSDRLIKLMKQYDLYQYDLRS